MGRAHPAGAHAKPRRQVDAALDVEEAALFILSAVEGTPIAPGAAKSSAPFDALFRMVFDVALDAPTAARPSCRRVRTPHHEDPDSEAE